MKITTPYNDILTLPMSQEDIDKHCLTCPYDADNPSCDTCGVRLYVDGGLNEVFCCLCGEHDSIDDMPVLFDGRDICWTCADEQCSTCSECGLMFMTAEMLDLDDGLYMLCPQCAKARIGITLPSSQLALEV